MNSREWIEKFGCRMLLLALGCLQVMILPPALRAAVDFSDLGSESMESRPWVPQALADDLQQGLSREVLLLFDDTAIRREIGDMGINPEERLVLRADRYPLLKADVLSRLAATDGSLIRDYSYLPISFVKLQGQGGLDWLRSNPEILAVYENGPMYADLTQSLPFIGQPEVAAASFTGQGTTVAVIDTGVKYTKDEFGPCTAPGIPDGCRVVASVDIAADDGLLDDNGHGTNVSAIVAGVAPGAKLTVLDIFDGSSSSDALVLGGLNWVLANYAIYGIRAVNMSLGNGIRYTSPCDKWSSNPYLLPIADLREVGIVVVASAGNNAYLDGITLPACTAGVLSVGAVYDANVGTRNWSVCTDATTGADQVACFSNSASFLSTLAPGGLITAGGYTMSGTSQAAPHITGAATVLAAAEPLFTADDIGGRLTSTGVAVIDHRNGLQFPRLDLAAALAPEIEAAAAVGEEEEVPFLPGWALLTLGAGLVLSGIRKAEMTN
jgi:subtilisin family serine protease